MAAYRRVDDLRSPAGWLPVHRDQLRAQRSVSSMGNAFTFAYMMYSRTIAIIEQEKNAAITEIAHVLDIRGA